MQLAKAFERLVLARVEQLPRSPRGRPLKLADADALAFLFKVLRTGMQWREVGATVCHTTIFRRTRFKHDHIYSSLVTS